MIVSFFLAAALAIASPASATTIIDDFEKGVGLWSPTLQYGQVANCKLGTGPGKGGGLGLQVDYALEAQGTNHILYARDVRLRLSGFETISFDVKGTGDPSCIFLFLFDSRGRFNNYGTHGSNRDFTTGYPEWHRLAVDLQRDQSCQGGDADLGDIVRVGLFLWSDRPARGTVWFDSLVCENAGAHLRISPSEITPNGDGINDACTIVYVPPAEGRVTVEILDAGGDVVARLLEDAESERPGGRLSWDGRADGKPVRDATYTVRALFGSAQPVELKASVAVRNKPPVPPIRYDVKPFFPVGVWFEGGTGISGCPSDPAGARRYYEACFADLAAHGFNAVAVPNCPENLWTVLLDAAHKYGLRVSLEIGPLVGLVTSKQPLTEAAVEPVVRSVVDRIGKHPALMRYQILDEPPLWTIPNWIVVQRLLAQADPRHPAFSCFCDAAAMARLTADTSVSEAVFDIYPHSGATPTDTLGSFLPSLDRFLNAARGATSWAVLQAFAAPDSVQWRYPTPTELRAVTYLSLAAGARGVFYFIYQHLPGYLQGLTEIGPDLSLQRKPLFGPTVALARELRKLAPLLLTLKPARTSVEAEGDARVGHFVTPAGKPVLIVASTQPGKPVTVRIRTSRRSWTDALTGERLAAKSGVLLVALYPGAGRVLVGR